MKTLVWDIRKYCHHMDDAQTMLDLSYLQALDEVVEKLKEIRNEKTNRELPA